MKNTAKIFLFVTAILLYSGCGQAMAAEKQARMDILYMNHGPMRPTIAKIKDLLTGYPDVRAFWYDVDTDSGKRFMSEQKIQGHIPLLIMLGGQSSFNLGDKNVQLQGFPTGASPFKQVEGNWSLDDLRHILDNMKE